MSQYIEKAQSILRAHRFVQLTAGWCPDCVYANSIWKKYGVLDKVYLFDISKLPTREEGNAYRDAFHEISGIRWLPTIFVNGTKWGTEADLRRLDKEGKLVDELKKVGLLQ